MADIEGLERTIRAAVDAAADEAALDAVRVSALGKKGSVSELLKTLGTMTPAERQTAGPAINGLKDRVNDALTARKTTLRDEATAKRLAAEAVDVTLPVRRSPLETGRIHPVSQVIEEITELVGQGIITDVEQVGGYPEYHGTPYKDTDSDGMPDEWEIKYGLAPNDPSDAAKDLNGDGYTNIEDFLNGLDPTAPKKDWSAPRTYKDLFADVPQ